MDIEQISLNTRFLLVSLPNNDMSVTSPFAIQKALIEIGGEPKSVKRLRSRDLLVETTSALQTKSFLLAKSFLNNPVTVIPHKSLNSCRGVISEPDLLGTSVQRYLKLTQTYAQATGPSTLSTTTQTDPNITNVICPPLQCLTPKSSKNPLPSTSSSPRHLHLLKDGPSPSGIIPTIQSESLLQIPIPTTTTTTSPGNNLNTLVSPLETKTRSHTPPDKLNSVSTENLPESVPNASNSEHSNAAEAQQFVKRKSRNRRKRPKVQKPDIEIKRVPHRSSNAAPAEITTDDEDMITYDVEEEELEQDSPNINSPLTEILYIFLKDIYAH
ncbi:RNA-directed DNA polymerase from mobile element jockey [Trichonephila clavipes]|nr:RNA-directed DNA polymerase from mobile element jockey [Trichonephila clavipes]